MAKVTVNKEYRSITMPLTVTATGQKLLESEYYVEGYATTFNSPYELYRIGDKKYYEVIDRHALDNADMSDVIMQYDHTGRIYARNSNNTLLLNINDRGLLIAADLSKTQLSRELYEDIKAEMINKMSWSFIVKKDKYDKATRTRTILKVSKIYDVSAVSVPANDDTTISARDYFNAQREKEQQMIKRIEALKILSTI
jgi:HK97 family phage prohead protease|nr:MAG TPA: prohead serine protease [Caudoviricetes sp.]